MIPTNKKFFFLILFLSLFTFIQKAYSFERSYCLPFNECQCVKVKVTGFVINHYGCGLLCHYYDSVIKEYSDVLKQDFYCYHLR